MKGEYGMQIIDAQIHLWGTGLPSNLAHRQVTAFTPEEAIVLMDEGGVDAPDRTCRPIRTTLIVPALRQEKLI